MTIEKNILGCFVSNTVESEWSENKKKLPLNKEEYSVLIYGERKALAIH